MAHFFRSGNTYMVAPADAVNMTDTLPPGNYVVKYNDFKGFYLETSESFKLPGKVYGNCGYNAERILSTFNGRDRNTGVLLVGEKGSGKTLLARKIARDSNMPVLVINSGFTGDNFNSFLSSITQPCMVFFDEFEKIYDKDSQEKILTLLDGTYQSRKLFVITSNDKWRIDTHMRNRPGRIFYLLEFGGLSEEFIVEYCDDNLLPQYKHLAEKIVEVSALFDVFNFDLLVAFVEEINRYGDEPKQLLPLLNAKPEYSGDISYSVQLFIRDIQVIPAALDCKALELNTTSGEFDVGVYFSWGSDDEDLSSEISKELSEYETPNPDMDKIHGWLKSGDLSLGRPTGNVIQIHRDNKKFTRYDFEFTPDDITEYLGTKSIVYVSDDKVKVILTREDKNTKKPIWAM